MNIANTAASRVMTFSNLELYRAPFAERLVRRKHDPQAVERAPPVIGQIGAVADRREEDLLFAAAELIVIGLVLDRDESRPPARTIRPAPSSA